MPEREWDTRDYWMDLYNRQLRATRHQEWMTSITAVVMLVVGIVIGRLA